MHGANQGVEKKIVEPEAAIEGRVAELVLVEFEGCIGLGDLPAFEPDSVQPPCN